jgi:hypothetical protein
VKQFKYVGPYDEVEVPALAAFVKQGEVLQVDDPEIAAGFDGQEQWEHIPDPERSKAAKKAADTRANNDSQEG